MTTDRQAHVHVSGHPGRPELLAMYGWIRPQVLVPVHGELRHMAEQARLGQEAGIPNAIFQNNGSLVRLAPGTPAIIGHASTRSEEHTSELQSLMRISYAVFCLKTTKTQP